ncbi:MAG TPA: CarD family transcriptional regulator [Anaerolineaceae bacterium]|nr:CarD family transcriptional regulator [Anaerolineaceae bacterium]
MGFRIGDKVIHCTFGLGEIVNIEEKIIHDQLTNCYVVRLNDMMTWIPIDDLQQHTVRMPSPPEEFERFSAILTRPGEALPEDRVLRKNQLLAQIRDGQLASICEVVRDLTYFKRSKKLNGQENSILERATNSLLTEWAYSIGISMLQARQELASLLAQ